jgi:hypothetical protein
LGVALAIALGSTSQARVPANGPPTRKADISSPAIRHARARGLEPGMVVVDRRGARVGLIRKTNRLNDGQPAVEMLVNGTPITVKASRFRLSRRSEEAIISMTRSQIRTAAILNTD